MLRALCRVLHAPRRRLWIARERHGVSWTTLCGSVRIDEDRRTTRNWAGVTAVAGLDVVL